MDYLEQLATDLGQLLGRSGPLAPAILFATSLIEYVFPPFPGDLLVVFGAWYAVQGAISWPAALIAATAGAVVGSAVDYQLGRWLWPRLGARAARRGPLSAERLARFTEAYRRHGSALLLVNRFLPGLRAFIFLAAGAARIPFGRVLLLGGLSALLWNTLLLGAGALLVQSLPELIELVRTYAKLAWAAVILLALVFGAVAWRRRASRTGGGEPR